MMAEPCVDRRKRLEDVFAAGVSEPRLPSIAGIEEVGVISSPRQAMRPGCGRCGWSSGAGSWIVLKDRRSPYKPGARSRCWWKAKNKLVLPVEILQCAETLVPWGDWGQACVMAFEYRDPRTGELVTAEQGVRVGVGRSSQWTPRCGPAEVLCWGLLRSGLLRHPLFMGWAATAG
jgi:ATP-dependent DNA ligase